MSFLKNTRFTTIHLFALKFSKGQGFFNITIFLCTMTYIQKLGFMRVFLLESQGKIDIIEI